MTLGSSTGEQELFTVSEVAEALGATEDEVIQRIDELRGEIEEAGEDTEKYFKQTNPGQLFIIPPRGLTS